ncbi:MAG: PilN domain-containing protein [Terriglobia bacterium]|jgi:Tfp pilus assembly protein PilN
MKVVLNLAIPPSARERYALYWAIPATLLGVTGLAFLLLFTVRSFREYKAVQKSVAEQQGRENTLRAQEMALRKQLEEPESRRLLDDVQFVNTLIEKKRVSLSGLATDITDLMPDEVRLTGLALAPEGQELAVRFVITGKSEEAVERFLSDLEDSPHFKDVAIVNQGFEQTGAASELENIACTAHYLPGESEASGE